MSKTRIKIAIVNYLNTKPFIYGLRSGLLKDEIELIECIPAECASLFHSGAVDLSLIPVGALNREFIQPISDFGIASDGPVASVCILSEVPMNEIKRVYLDYQSRTSVLLARLLFRNYWKHEPIFLSGFAGYESLIKGTTAGLVIGDRALEFKSNYPYVYDLGQAWREYAHLPFVYAIWQQTKSLSADFLQTFNQSLQLGINNISQLIPTLSEFDEEVLTMYYTKNIKYKLNELDTIGLQKFLSEADTLSFQESNSLEKSLIS